MKNVFKVLGIIAIAAVIGFSMVSCKSDNDDGGDGIEMSFVYWPMLGGDVRVGFDGAVTSDASLDSLVQDFKLTIDDAKVTITKVGFLGGCISLGLDTTSYVDGTEYNISVTYTPNDARQIVYMESNKPLGAFTKTQKVKFEKNK